MIFWDKRHSAFAVSINTKKCPLACHVSFPLLSALAAFTTQKPSVIFGPIPIYNSRMYTCGTNPKNLLPPTHTHYYQLIINSISTFSLFLLLSIVLAH